MGDLFRQADLKVEGGNFPQQVERAQIDTGADKYLTVLNIGPDKLYLSTEADGETVDTIDPGDTLKLPRKGVAGAHRFLRSVGRSRIHVEERFVA